MFWLFQCIIVLIPGLAPYSSYTTISGFCFVLAVTLTKDFYEDYQRLKADRNANAQPVEVLRDGRYVCVCMCVCTVYVCVCGSYGLATSRE
jgi:magnesium-transporting ATPase (P-type)